MMQSAMMGISFPFGGISVMLKIFMISMDNLPQINHVIVLTPALVLLVLLFDIPGAMLNLAG